MSELRERLIFDEKNGAFRLTSPEMPSPQAIAYASVMSTAEQQRRLVAAWNYCAGCPTELLEKERLENTVDAVFEAEKERDEVIEVLREREATLKKIGDTAVCNNAVHGTLARVRKLLAKHAKVTAA